MIINNIFLIFIIFCTYKLVIPQTTVINLEEYNNCTSTYDTDLTNDVWSAVLQSNHLSAYTTSSCYHACQQVATNYNILWFQQDKRMQRIITLDPHYQVKLTGVGLMIDHWANGEKFNIIFDGTTVHQEPFVSASATDDICDVGIVTGVNDMDFNFDTGFQNHSELTLKLEIEGLASDSRASFGLDTMSLIINPCHSSCKKCTGPLNTDCTDCPDYYYLNSGQCQACYAGCKVCNSNAQAECYICGTGILELTGPTDTYGECKASQPTGHYQTTCTSAETGENIDCYKSCYTNCNTQGSCNGPTNAECTSCNTSFTFFSGLGCFPDCDPAYNCLRCQANGTSCITCKSTHYLNADGSTCSDPCPSGYYEDSSDNTCQQCHANCIDCTTDATTCTDCVTDYALYNNACIDDGTCPNGFYYKYDSGANPKRFCDTCTSDCQKCKTDAVDQCIRCSSGYMLFNDAGVTEGQCYTICPAGTYEATNGCTDPISGTNIDCCLSCDVSCNTSSGNCDGPLFSDCQSCNSNYTFHSGIGCEITCNNSYNCLRCLNDQISCISCKTNFYLQGSLCVATCTGAFYGNSTSGQCEACTTGCATCTGNATTCTDCKSGYALFGNTCYNENSCPNNTYFLLDGSAPYRICDDCSTGCLKCDDDAATNCTRCDTGKKINFTNVTKTLGECVSTCPTGTYLSTNGCLDIIDGTTPIDCCKTCDDSCNNTGTCNGPAIGDCLSCDTGFTFWSGEGCRATCDPSKNCEKCQSNGTSCESCASGYYLNDDGITCTSACPVKFFENSSNRTCVDCDANCIDCTTDASTCTDCVSGSSLHNNACISTCPTGYYAKYDSGADPERYCDACTSGCDVCNTEAVDECIRCTSGYMLFSDVGNTKGQCYVSCPAGTYEETDGCSDPQLGTDIDCCLPCDVSCDSSTAACTGPLFSDCTSCDTGFTFHTGIGCEVDCDSTKHCERCQVDTVSCISCEINYFLSGIQCLNSCSGAFYENTSTRQCQPCATGCSKCNSGASICQDCISGYGLHQQSCYSTCPDFTYFLLDTGNSPLRVCAACPTGCEKCIDDTVTNCRRCETGKKINFSDVGQTIGECVTNCPAGTYFQANGCLDIIDGVTQIDCCLPCDDACNDTGTCDGPNIGDCTSCDTGFTFWVGEGCRITCDPTKNCEKCENNGTSCISCQNTYFLEGVVCDTTCPDSKYERSSDNTCQPCDNSCATCDSGPTDCTDCVSGYALDGITCVNENSCPSRYFFELKLTAPYRVCSSCATNCLSCTGSNSTECTSCDTGFYLDILTNTCTNSCPNGYYENTANNICTDCFIGCLTCLTSPTECDSCAVGYHLDVDQCTSDCPERTYYEVSDNTCSNCTDNCLLCGGPDADECIRCDSVNNWFIQFNAGQATYGTCSQNGTSDSFLAQASDQYCQDPITGVDISCFILCNAKCTSCTGPLVTECLTCASNYIYIENQGCIFTCTNPGLNCFTCFDDDSTCINCDPGFYLYQGVCAATCPALSQTYQNSGTWTCDNCAKRCSTCSNRSDFCQSCNSGYYFHSVNQDCYQTCPSNSYHNNTAQTCELCHADCKECTGPDTSDCTACWNSKPVLFDGTCVTCSDFDGLEDDPDNIGECWDICGDGKTVRFFGTNSQQQVTDNRECDDGNSITDDGCDLECMIQPGWGCEGGSIDSVDVCKDITPVTVQFEFVNFSTSYTNMGAENKVLQVIIRFVKKIYFPQGKALKDYLRIDVVGVGQNLGRIVEIKEVELDQEDANPARRHLEYPPVIEGPMEFDVRFVIEKDIANRYIQINFINGDELLDYNGNTISYSSGEDNEEDIPLYLYHSESERNSAFKGGYVVSIFVGITQIGALLLLFTGRYFHAIAAVDIIQMCDLTQFLDIPWPINAKDYYERLNPMRLDWLMPNLFEEALSEGQRLPGSGFESQGHDASFLKNMGVNLVITLILLLVYILLKLFSYIRCSLPCASGLNRYRQSILEWGYFIDILNYMTLYWVSFGFLNYISMNLTTAGTLISVILAHICWILPFVFVVLGIRYIFVMQQKLYPDFELMDENFWTEIYNSSISRLNTTFRWRNMWYLLKQNNYVQTFFLMFLMARKIAYGIVIVTVTTQASLQILIYAFMNISLIVLLISLRPYKRMRDNIRYIVSEFLLLFSNFALLLLNNEDNRENEDKRKDYAWIMIFTQCIAIVINVLSLINESMFALFLNLYFKINRKSMKKSVKVANLPTDDPDQQYEKDQDPDDIENDLEYEDDQEKNSDASAILPIKSDFRKNILNERDLINFEKSEFKKYRPFKLIGQKPKNKQKQLQEQVYQQQQGIGQFEIFEPNSHENEQMGKSFTSKADTRKKYQKITVKNTKIHY